MRTVLKSAAFSLAILAMMLRAAVPQGWMPTSQGAAALMPCPGVTQMAHMPHQTPPRKPDHRHDNGAPCIFAAAAHLASPAGALPAILTTPAFTSIDFATTRETLFLAPAYRANAARAPPVPI
jgi:hypothetical protein